MTGPFKPEDFAELSFESFDRSQVADIANARFQCEKGGEHEPIYSMRDGKVLPPNLVCLYCNKPLRLWAAVDSKIERE